MKLNSLKSNQLELNVKIILINMIDSLDRKLNHLILNNQRYNKKKQLRNFKKSLKKSRNTVKSLLFCTNLLWKLTTNKINIKKNLTKKFLKIQKVQEEKFLMKCLTLW